MKTHFLNWKIELAANLLATLPSVSQAGTIALHSTHGKCFCSCALGLFVLIQHKETPSPRFLFSFESKANEKLKWMQADVRTCLLDHR